MYCLQTAHGGRIGKTGLGQGLRPVFLGQFKFIADQLEFRVRGWTAKDFE